MTASRTFDVLIRGGTVSNGGGAGPFTADVGIVGDSIAHVAADLEGRARTEINAQGMAVAPGFINLLSRAVDSLMADGR